MVDFFEKLDIFGSKMGFLTFWCPKPFEREKKEEKEEKSGPLPKKNCGIDCLHEGKNCGNSGKMQKLRKFAKKLEKSRGNCGPQSPTATCANLVIVCMNGGGGK
jgi:hypothetical protein